MIVITGICKSPYGFNPADQDYTRNKILAKLADDIVRMKCVRINTTKWYSPENECPVVMLGDFNARILAFHALQDSVITDSISKIQLVQILYACVKILILFK